MATKTEYVYNANGVDFTVCKVEKPTKPGPKTYWLLEIPLQGSAHLKQCLNGSR
jgi:hypothetical protein